MLDVTAGTSRVDRWRDVARLVIVTIGVSLALMVTNRTAVGPDILSALDWGAYLLPPVLVSVGLDILRRSAHERPLLRFEEINGIIALFLAGIVAFGSQHHGGPIGNALDEQIQRFFGAQGIPLVSAFLLALGLVLALHLTFARVWVGLHFSSRVLLRAGQSAGSLVSRVGSGVRQQRHATVAPVEAKPVKRIAAAKPTLPDVEIDTEDDEDDASATPLSSEEIRQIAAELAAEPLLSAESDSDEESELLSNESAWTYPPIDLLDPVPVEADNTPTDNALRMRVIEDTLAAFNVRARVVGSHTGPTITQFDVQPERGTRVQRVTALQNDLALSLAARSIRIQAPVPGHPVIGIEIPNAKSSVVTLREVLESDVCSKMKSPLKIALGKDVSGVPVMADLARMPHLLIAGATGSGKSVCLNSLISCLLFHNSPERLRLLMVDPKMVELSVFNDIPHLLAPVVTDVTKVTGTLKWALKEMHRRYKLFAKIGARNLARYNELQTDTKEILPFIVLIIDELADLMMVSPEDVEDGICRLAQLARATGMHLVLATQRPSVDVITGLIKANFPARIAFAVSSQVDSRTILDQAGAEKLLGRGDMLYQPSDEGKPVRVQGTYLSDREIEELVRFWKTNSPRTVEQIPAIELEPPPKEEEPDADDKLLNDAITVLREYRRASVSLLQRRLSIGYTRAARLLDVLEDRGVVGPSEDGRSRVVLDVAGADLDDGTTSEGEAGTDDDEAPPL
ncbi:MAG: cell division protein FtsK [Chloroflexi bacterium]|nr:cell division protein FtsK [Chloroflexota bacterium]